MLPKLEKAEKTALVHKLQAHLQDEFDPETGELQSELLLEFVAELVGPLIYNEALRDARSMAARHAESLDEDLIAMEKPLTKPTERGRR